MKIQELKNVSIGDIKPYEHNPRKNDEAVKAVMASIEEFGFRGGILIDENNVIINGHTRYKAAVKLGMEEVPCIICEDLSEEQKRALRLVDNRTNELAEWDDDKLAEELRAISEIDMSIWDFDFDNFEMPEIKEVKPREPEEVEVRAKSGDIWALGEHRLVIGDTAKKATLDKLMKGELADLVFTDPPYGVAIGDKNKAINAVDSNRKGGRIEDNIVADDIGEEELYKLLLKAFVNIREHCKEDASYYVTSPQGGSLGLMMMMMMRDAGLPVRHVLMWNKSSATFSLGRLDYDYKHEPLFYTWTKRHHNYRRGEFRTTVWDVDKPLSSRLHPTMKPIRLIANALLDGTNEGDIVLDGFGGSGSTLIACEELGRRARLAEIDPHYADVILQRWEDLSGKKAEKIK